MDARIVESPTITTRLITNCGELAPLEDAWNALASDAPLRSWDWLGTWWRHYGQSGQSESASAAGHERQLFVVAVYEHATEAAGGGERLLGVGPWYLESTLLKGSVLRWLGGGEVCTDHLSLICRPEHRQQVAAAIAERLTTTCDQWDCLELSGVDEDDETARIFVEELLQRDCEMSRRAAGACWVLDLPPNWEDYLASLSKSHRKQLRQSERRVLESDRVTWRRVETAAELERGWEVLVDLHQRRRHSLGEPGCFASAAFHDFHREVAGRLLRRGQLRLSWLELDGRPAAAEYHLAGGAATFAYQGGVDPDRLVEEPGRLSTILCLRAAIEEGHREFDFLRGSEPYKAHWRATPRATLDYQIAPNRRMARWRGRVATATDTLTGWMRQGAHLLVEK